MPALASIFQSLANVTIPISLCKQSNSASIIDFADDPAAPAPNTGILPNLNDWSIHGQSTIIGMSNAPFPAAYSGKNSLFPGYQTVETVSLDGYLGYKAFEGTEFYFNPEPFQGFGLSQTRGVAGSQVLKRKRLASTIPITTRRACFCARSLALAASKRDLPDGPDQVGEKADISRVTFTFGKISIPDIFDNNTYAHDGRSSFMNWALNDAGAFDYVADQKGYTWGAALELNQKDWALRADYFLEPDVPNGNNFDTRIFERGQSILEFEDRFTLFGAPAKFRLTGWETQCYCGSFAATITNPFLVNPALDGGTPNIAATHKTRSEFGFIGNFEEAVYDDLGLFARLSWQSGQTEIVAWTDIDESVSFGGVLKGTSWGRPNDRVGLAGVVNGLFRQLSGLSLQQAASA